MLHIEDEKLPRLYRYISYKKDSYEQMSKMECQKDCPRDFLWVAHCVPKFHVYFIGILFWQYICIS